MPPIEVAASTTMISTAHGYRLEDLAVWKSQGDKAVVGLLRNNDAGPDNGDAFRSSGDGQDGAGQIRPCRW